MSKYTCKSSKLSLGRFLEFQQIVQKSGQMTILKYLDAYVTSFCPQVKGTLMQYPETPSTWQ